METDTAEQLNAIGDTASATVRQVALSHLVTQYVQNVSDEFFNGCVGAKMRLQAVVVVVFYVFLFLIFCFFMLFDFSYLPVRGICVCNELLCLK